MVNVYLQVKSKLHQPKTANSKLARLCLTAWVVDYTRLTDHGGEKMTVQCANGLLHTLGAALGGLDTNMLKRMMRCGPSKLED